LTLMGGEEAGGGGGAATSVVRTNTTATTRTKTAATPINTRFMQVPLRLQAAFPN